MTDFKKIAKRLNDYIHFVTGGKGLELSSDPDHELEAAIRDSLYPKMNGPADVNFYILAVDWGGMGLWMGLFDPENPDLCQRIYSAISDEPGGKEWFINRVIEFDREKRGWGKD